jgi:hypothetical protein
MPDHPTYAYSIEPTGLWRYDGQGVEFFQVGRAQLLHAKQLYANYKLTNGNIRWTPRPITVAKHEDVVYEQIAPNFWQRFFGAEPKAVLRRVRCGNTLSTTPQLPVMTQPQAQLILPAADLPKIPLEPLPETPFLPMRTVDFPLTIGAAAVPALGAAPVGSSAWPSVFAGVPGLGFVGPGIGLVSSLPGPATVVVPIGPAVANTPEPSTVSVVLLGLLVVAILMRRRTA